MSTTNRSNTAAFLAFGYQSHSLYFFRVLYLRQVSSVGKRLLLVDDDEQLIALLAMRLDAMGYVVSYTANAKEAYCLAARRDFDVIVMDVVMPHITGIELCGRLREEGVLTPILLLSGQTEKAYIVDGLNAGADDYITKPFDDTELVARIEALLRREKKAFATQVLRRGDVELDVNASIVRISGESALLTPKELLLLRRLVTEAPQPVSRLALLQDVWGIGAGHASNRLDVYIRRLRQKLRDLGGEDYIYTVRAGGYYFRDTASSGATAHR